MSVPTIVPDMEILEKPEPEITFPSLLNLEFMTKKEIIQELPTYLPQMRYYAVETLATRIAKEKLEDMKILGNYSNSHLIEYYQHYYGHTLAKYGYFNPYP